MGGPRRRPQASNRGPAPTPGRHGPRRAGCLAFLEARSHRTPVSARFLAVPPTHLGALGRRTTIRLTCSTMVEYCAAHGRSEEHTSELQSRFGISYAVFCLKK